MSQPASIICPKCGEDNPFEAEICWACYTPLHTTAKHHSEPTTEACPQCGEDNPPDAVMCWSCRTPLGTAAQRHFASQKQEEKRRQKRMNLSQGAFMTSFFGGVALVTASGYLPRRRFSLLGLGLIAASAPFAWLGWESINDKRRREQESQLVYEAPAVRYANQILLYSLRQNAREIRFHTADRGVSVEYLVDDELKSGTALPLELWPELRAGSGLIRGDVD